MCKKTEIVGKNLNLYPEIIVKLNIVDLADEKILKIVEDYIENHKYFLNEAIPYTVTLEQAFFSWYENVFRPQISAMEESNIFLAIDNKTNLGLFDMVSKEHYFLSLKEDRKNDYVPHTIACYHVILRESTNWLCRLKAKIRLKYGD